MDLKDFQRYVIFLNAVMSDLCILFDLPTCLAREICSVWIGGNKETRQGLGLKALLRLDTAVCNKQLRQSLLEFYHHLDWEMFLAADGSGCTGLKMKWVVARRILLPRLVLSHFPDEVDTIRSFFKCNGTVLKVLKLSDFRGAMTLLTKAIASDCKVLETLSLERCNLTMPIADILNKTVSIKEVRFQNKPASYRRPRNRPEGPCGVKVALFERITCTSVVKLALLDPVLSEDADVIARAFPNVKDFEMHKSTGDALVKLLGTWKDIEVLRLTGMKDMSGSVISDIVAQVKASLKTVVAEETYLWATSIASLLLHCDNLSSITFNGHRSELLLIARLAERYNARLEVLSVGQLIVSAEDIAALAEHCPNLRVLNMHHLGFCANYELLLSKCTRLEKLRLSPQCRFINNTYVSNCAELSNAIGAHCNNLRILSFATKVEPAQISGLIHCAKLRVLETSSYNLSSLVGTLKGVEIRYFGAYPMTKEDF